MNGVQPNGVPHSSTQRHDTTQSRKQSKLYKLKDEIMEGRYVIFCIVNIWKILVTFGMVLVIFGTSCKDDECINAVLGLNKTSTPIMSSDVFGKTVLYHRTSCDTATPFIVAVTGMVASLVCHR